MNMKQLTLRNIIFIILIVLFVPVAIYLLVKGEFVFFGAVALFVWLLSKAFDRYLPR
ncbi:MAG: hypothetical protein ACQESE_05010 [Nanobdellota archaeon]